MDKTDHWFLTPSQPLPLYQVIQHHTNFWANKFHSSGDLENIIISDGSNPVTLTIKITTHTFYITIHLLIVHAQVHPDITIMVDWV